MKKETWHLIPQLAHKRLPQAIMCRQNGKPRRNGSISKDIEFPKTDSGSIREYKEEKLRVIKFNQ